MKSIVDGLDEINKDLRSVETFINSRKDFERIHKDNIFNRRFSEVLSSFSDLKAVGNRLQRNIAGAESLNREIQKRFEKEDKDTISETGQQLHKEEYEITMENQADFKSLYFFAKIFLDKYTSLIRFIFNWRGIGDKSVTNFYKDIEKYSGEDEQVNLFKKDCFIRLRAVDVFITQYRDKYIAHDQHGHKETRWFLTDMKGSIRFLGGRPSITPQELIFIVSNYLTDTVKFMLTNLQ